MPLALHDPLWCGDMVGEMLLAMAAGGFVFEIVTPKKKPTVKKVKEMLNLVGPGTKLTNGTLVKAMVVDSEPQDYGWLLKLTVPYGISIEHFLKMQCAYEMALNAEVEFEARDGLVWMYVYDQELPDYTRFKLPDDNDMTLPITVGKSRSGLEICDLVDGPHMLVGGTSGRGKSNFLHTLVISLLSLRPNARLVVVDMKRMEFDLYKNHVEYIYDFDHANRVISLLHQEVFRRQELLSEAGCSDIREYQGDDCPYYVLVIDEFAQFSPDLGKTKEEGKRREFVHNMLVEMTCLARSVGIHVILCMQRPDAKVLPGQIKQNIGPVVSFRCMNDINSKILLGHSGAELLTSKVKGRAIYQFGDYEREVQVAHLPQSGRRKVLKQLPHRNWSIEEKEMHGVF